MSTNAHTQRSDEVNIRPGRCRTKLQIKFASPQQLIDHWFPGSSSSLSSGRLEGKPMSFGHFIHGRTQYEEGEYTIEEWKPFEEIMV